MGNLILATRKYKAGYEVRVELHKIDLEAELLSGEANEETAALIRAFSVKDNIIVKSAYTPSGDYIGDKRRAHFLITKRGIKPEKSDPEHNVCSIGFCDAEQKWYGWSHRAIFGFGIGAVAEEGDCCTMSGWIDSYLVDHPEADRSVPIGFEAKTLGDAKIMAIAFAESVG